VGTSEVRFSGGDVVTPNELAATFSREKLELMIEDVEERLRQAGRLPEAEGIESEAGS
jgi:hypothetical protein